MKLLTLFLPILAAAQPAAFPGAEGFGARTPGGRGGAAILVTNLNDAGPGSFRAACAAKGPRIVVFRVGGIIDLKSPIAVREPFLTIAAQTAPGDGVCLRGNKFDVATHDVVVRFLRSRLGDQAGAEQDAMGISTPSRDVIFDHCSASWSIDESLSPSGDIANITVQWSIIAEGLNRSIHSKGPHGYGSLVRATGGLTLHHNLWAHNDARNPRLGDNYGKPPFPTFDFRNNVIYDYGKMCSGLTGDVLSANYIGNFIRPGPSSDQRRRPIIVSDTSSLKYFVRGNVVDGHSDWTEDNTLLFDNPTRGGRKLVEIVTQPFDAPAVTTTPAREAFLAVLESAGATAPARDAVDQRLVSEARHGGQGSIIDSQAEVGGWPVYRSARPPADTDRDGIPDAWETAHRLDPRNPADAVQVDRATGYTHLENYVNSLALPR